jgi:uncharacterized protein (TIGR02231 family)
MTDITAPITEVTVYTDRALITRRGSIQLAEGEHELRVNDLPQFLRDSLRASGKSTGGARILNVDVTTAFYNRPPDKELQALQDELERLEHEHDLLKARQEALKDRRQWLRALGEQSKDFAHGLAHGQMKPEDCANFFRFMSDQSLQDAEAAQNLETELQKFQLDIQAKQRELDQKEGRARPDRQAAIITVELVEAGTFTLEISYLVTSAGWNPQYDVRVKMNEKDSTGEVELSYIGMVQQNTGENWENVELALSTARPSLAAKIPDLKPWYLNVYTPPPVMPLAQAAAPRNSGLSFGGMMPQSLGKAQHDTFAVTAAGMLEDELPSPAEAEIATTTIERTGTALVFRVGRSVDIPSDNSPHKTTIARDNLPCDFDYVSAPAIEENAHLRATIHNSTERVLLSGDASIFLSSEYVGTTQIKQTAHAEQFKIFLGVDDAIKVKRELLERTVDKGNLLQNDLRRSTYAYMITIHNYGPNQRKIVVSDHLPISQHERIRVRVQSIQPPPTERTKLELLKWEFHLPANGEQKIEYRFGIENPQGIRVIGLPSIN